MFPRPASQAFVRRVGQPITGPRLNGYEVKMTGAGVRRAVVTILALFVATLLTSTCSSPKPPPPAAPVQKLWGEMKPVVSVKELMRDFIDPASDYVFDAVGIVANKKGE